MGTGFNVASMLLGCSGGAFIAARLAVSGFAQWTANFVITMMFPIMLGSIGLAAAYGFYTVCAFISIGFVIKFVHETKGTELENMEG